MSVLAVTGVSAQTAPRPYVIETVSTHADRVSGGDVLVKITYNPVGQIGPLAIHWYGLTYLAAFGLFMWLANLRLHTAMAALTQAELDAPRTSFVPTLIGTLNHMSSATPPRLPGT